MSDHFCTCHVVKCAKHPLNHNEGCDLCIESNIKSKKMPTCMFRAISEDVSNVNDYSIKGFVDFFMKHNGGKTLD